MKVDRLSKELDKKTSALNKAENRVFEFRLMGNNTSPETENQAESFIYRKDALDTLRRRVSVEKEKHHECMKETERITLNGLQTGFCRVFESLTEFSRAAFSMYGELSSMEITGNR
ncbi:hypothetical protein F511_43446 [Dorcoceras hygrometricum]|uniref:Uncharacterized protein n=1 Tax=Dorcoceras hygrometricum TaxID=472368 RepID=A0A2Z7CPX0_9LAMI|nr:hypothetical protein F511_43446 [Dorcoceras hygrometricum]